MCRPRPCKAGHLHGLGQVRARSLHQRGDHACRSVLQQRPFGWTGALPALHQWANILTAAGRPCASPDGMVPAFPCAIALRRPRVHSLRILCYPPIRWPQGTSSASHVLLDGCRCTDGSPSQYLLHAPGHLHMHAYTNGSTPGPPPALRHRADKISIHKPFTHRAW